MNAVIVALLVAILVVATCVFFLHVKMALDAKTHKIDHAMCIAHVAHYVGNEFAASVLKAAAEDYNRPETQARLQILMREQWVEGGSLLPAIWMTNRAEALSKEVQP